RYNLQRQSAGHEQAAMENERSANLVARWQAGDQQAAAELFRRYAGRLVALARRRLSSRLAPRGGPEDGGQAVYRCVFAGSRAGRYELQRGGDLWRLLVVITLHKVNDEAKRHGSAKRALCREQHFGGEDSLYGLQPQALVHKPSPVEALALAEQLELVMR